MLDFKTSFAELSTAQIAYAEGPDNGPPIILIPGLTSTRTGFASVSGHLAEMYHIFAIDQRGMGGRVTQTAPTPTPSTRKIPLNLSSR
jgi:pimeloyl-ACP methyl ester carboxylesterase